MGLYYNPPQPHIGAAQPLEPKKLTPQSGPVPQNPPFMGGSRVRQEILNSWSVPAAAVVLQELFVPAVPAQAAPARTPDAIYQSWSSVLSNSQYASIQVVRESAARMTPPVSGPVPTDPPFNGGAEVSQAVLNWWIPPPPAPQSSILLEPPQSGPAPSNPPFVGGAKLAPGIAQWWSRDLVFVEISAPIVPQIQPDSAPVSRAATSLAEILISWLPKPPAPITARLLVPPVSGPVPQNPPIVGSRIPAAVLQWWIPAPPLPQLSEQVVPPSPVVVTYVPPPVGMPAAVTQWWALTAPAVILPRLLTPPQSGPDAFTFPPRGVPAAVSLWWDAPAQFPQLRALFVPASAAEFTFPRRDVAAQVLQWWSAAPQALQRTRPLTPPQSGPVAQNPPFAGGARVPIEVEQWWDVPASYPQQARPFNVIAKVVYSATGTVRAYSGTVTIGVMGGIVTVHEV